MTVIISGSGGITSVNGTAAAPSVTGTDTDTGIVYGTNTLSLATGGTTAVTVDSNQYVGVGIAPTVRFQILGAASGAAAIFGVGTNGNGGIVWRNASNTSVGYISVNSDNVDYRTTNDSTGAFLQKPGLTFPATQFPSADANTLDDYEEGTFTATLTGGTTNPSTPVTTTATYTKIGNIVYINVAFENVITTGASGQIIITGLPFTNSGNRKMIPSGFYGGASWAANTTPLGEVTANSTYIYANALTSAAAWGSVTHNAGSGRYFWYTGCYQV